MPTSGSSGGVRDAAAAPVRSRVMDMTGYRLLVIGAPGSRSSRLGPVLGVLPRNFPLPVVLVCHREEEDPGFLEWLRRSCVLPVEEADDKAPLKRGKVLLAPPDYHLFVDGDRVALSKEAPLFGRRPAISALVRTAVHSTRGQLFAVLLGETGEDGLAAERYAGSMEGTVLLHEAGEPFTHGGLDAAGLAARLRELAAWSQPC